MEVISPTQQIAELNKAIEARFREHHTFDMITSMPGLGVILGAEFLAATSGDMTVFGTAHRLAGFGASPRCHATPGRSAATYPDHGATGIYSQCSGLQAGGEANLPV
ncbi:transposase [Streptomyces chartreusis]|uniref:transposase n=1 Tax=Streptomyces chartreusis TaxID=1969 RepID=UPI002F90BE3B|nr:transposase [Streptomyces chartreusis]WTA33422.1 transposase [Streptomyces chartreusis]